MERTNVMRLLTQAGITFQAHTYDENVTDGMQVAALLGQDPARVFKTLVTTSGPGAFHVFVIPVAGTLDLKKAAATAHVKHIAMIRQKELLPLTGYVHGGCSPIGMKKPLPVFVEEYAQCFDLITLSAGRRGYQIELAPGDLLQYTGGVYADLLADAQN